MIEDLIDRLRLARSPGIGPITYRQLVARFGSAGAALAAVPDLARKGGGASPRIFGRDEAEREVATVEKLGARYVALGHGRAQCVGRGVPLRARARVRPRPARFGRGLRSRARDRQRGARRSAR